MPLLDEIHDKIRRHQYEFSKHALDQSIIRNISVAEIEEAIPNGTELVEDYPDDKYSSSCLILGCEQQLPGGARTVAPAILRVGDHVTVRPAERLGTGRAKRRGEVRHHRVRRIVGVDIRHL
ncbi:MAG: DUF4258 domain-containing protein [Methylococcales bacterium]